MPQEIGSVIIQAETQSLFKYQRQTSAAWYQYHWQPFDWTSSVLEFLLSDIMKNIEDISEIQAKMW